MDIIKLEKKLDEIDKRLSKVEKIVNNNNEFDYVEKSKLPHEEKTHAENTHIVKSELSKKKEKHIPSLSFNQVITFIGVIGIIIGIISFYFYAVANNWIGEAGQIGIGIIIGFVLFFLAYSLRQKNPLWSNIVFGGSYFIEYLTIGFGVLEFKVLPNIAGLGLALLFLISSIFLSMKFSSRVIAYFSVFGGILIPIITGFSSTNDLFVMLYYILLSIGLTAISLKKNWADLRLVTYILLFSVIGSYSYKLINSEITAVPALFLILIFVIYNISATIGSLRNKSSLSVLDSILIGFLPVTIMPLLYQVLDWKMEFFGILLLLLAFIYLGQIFYFKKTNPELALDYTYTMLSAGFLTLNIGLLFVLNTISSDYFMILFAVEWFLFSILSKHVKENLLFRIFSYIFLFLTAFYYLNVVRFNEGVLHGSFFMIIFALIVYGFYRLYIEDIDKNFNGALFIISGFALIFSFHKYLAFFLNNKSSDVNVMIASIVLSILWIIYTLFMYSAVKSKNAKILVGILLAITVIKIAFNDLFYLDGVYRIIAFIIFGILLIAGGYYLKNETTN